MALSIIFQYIFLLRNASKLGNEEFMRKWGCFYEGNDMKNPIAYLDKTIFLVRRLIYDISVVLLSSSPFIQICINASISAGIISYLVGNKPVINKVDLYIYIIIEACVCCVMSFMCVITSIEVRFENLEGVETIMIVVLYTAITLPTLCNLILKLIKIIMPILIGLKNENESIKNTIETIEAKK